VNPCSSCQHAEKTKIPRVGGPPPPPGSNPAWGLVSPNAFAADHFIFQKTASLAAITPAGSRSAKQNSSIKPPAPNAHRQRWIHPATPGHCQMEKCRPSRPASFHSFPSPRNTTLLGKPSGLDPKSGKAPRIGQPAQSRAYPRKFLCLAASHFPWPAVAQPPRAEQWLLIQVKPVGPEYSSSLRPSWLAEAQAPTAQA